MGSTLKLSVYRVVAPMSLPWSKYAALLRCPIPTSDLHVFNWLFLQSPYSHIQNLWNHGQWPWVQEEMLQTPSIHSHHSTTIHTQMHTQTHSPWMNYCRGQHSSQGDILLMSKKAESSMFLITGRLSFQVLYLYLDTYTQVSGGLPAGTRAVLSRTLPQRHLYHLYHPPTMLLKVLLLIIKMKILN